MVRLDAIITNGYIDKETIVNFEEKGWKFVSTLPAKQIHPHAADTDKVTIFAQYIKPSLQDEESANNQT